MLNKTISSVRWLPNGERGLANYSIQVKLNVNKLNANVRLYDFLFSVSDLCAACERGYQKCVNCGVVW